ncbi:MAG: NAD(P)/FAD-dependent oxidoreductase [Rhodospirillales bacterium]
MSAEPAEKRHVTVIGAGIVGISCAVHLLRGGHAVRVVDRLPPGEGCSKGNAGMFSSDSFVPLGLPGDLWNVPGWLLDPLGPLAIRWRHAPRLLPWLSGFLKAGRPERVAEICDALAPLLASSPEHHKRLAKGTAAEGLIRRQGAIYVYENAKSLAKDELAWTYRRERGSVPQPLTAAEIRELEPALAPIYEHGYLMPDLGHTTEPMRLVKALAEHFQQSGGEIARREVRDIDIGPDGPRRLLTDAGELDLDVLVIAAGAWSGRLAAKLGYRVPIEGERGYHITVANPGIGIGMPVFVATYKFIATPMDPGLRFAGTAEFAGLESEPNPGRWRVLVRHAKRMFPEIDTSEISEWAGLRPTLPDSLPVIGPAPGIDNVIFAFGHQHVGLTAGPRTGEIIADLVGGRAPNIDLRPFRVDRF